jgi:two-component system OmpR family sensor kinase
VNSLRGRLVAAFLIVVLLGVIFVWVGALWATRATFRSYLSKQHKARALALSDILLGYYEAYGSWYGVESLFAGPGWGHHGRGIGRMQQAVSNNRVVVFGKDGSVVLDTRADCIPDASILRDDAVNITLNGAIVGSVAVTLASPTAGTLGILEDDFLSRVERVLAVTGLVSLAVALAIGFRMSLGLAMPIECLERAAVEVAKGRLGRGVSIGRQRLPAEVERLIQAFNTMSHRLEEADTKRKDLARDLAHEIRTPLTILQGNLEAVSVGVGELDKDTLQSMLEEVSRLSGLVDSLTELDRIAIGYDLSPEPVPGSVLIQKAVSSVQGMAGKHSIRVNTNIQGGLGSVYVDSSTIQQVFSNLLTNAIRYTPKHGVIEVGASKYSSSQALFWVRDSGPGIPEEDIPRIFERFFRGDPSRARSTGGSGLGLAIVQGLVEGSGGSIWAENHPEGGAIFYFTLPTFSH